MEILTLIFVLWENNYIHDIAPITVGYEYTVYTTSEDQGTVELCAIIYDPPSGLAPRDFVILSTIRDGTAGYYNYLVYQNFITDY